MKIETYWIGEQKILQEEELANGIIRVLLEPHTEPIIGGGDVNKRTRCKGLNEYETLELPVDVLERIKSTDKKGDTYLKNWCFPASQEVIQILIKNAIPRNLVKTTLDIAHNAIIDAETVKQRKLTGHHEHLETVYSLKTELEGQ